MRNIEICKKCEYFTTFQKNNKLTYGCKQWNLFQFNQKSVFLKINIPNRCPYKLEHKIIGKN